MLPYYEYIFICSKYSVSFFITVQTSRIQNLMLVGNCNRKSILCFANSGLLSILTKLQLFNLIFNLLQNKIHYEIYRPPPTKKKLLFWYITRRNIKILKIVWCQNMGFWGQLILWKYPFFIKWRFKELNNNHLILCIIIL